MNRVVSNPHEFVDWSLYTANGDPYIVPRALQQLVSAVTEAQIVAAYWRLDGSAVHSGAVYTSSLPAVRFLIANLNLLSALALPWALEFLLQVAGGYLPPTVIDSTSVTIIDQCRQELLPACDLFIELARNSDVQVVRCHAADLLYWVAVVTPRRRSEMLSTFRQLIADKKKNGDRTIEIEALESNIEELMKEPKDPEQGS